MFMDSKFTRLLLILLILSASISLLFGNDYALKLNFIDDTKWLKTGWRIKSRRH